MTQGEVIKYGLDLCKQEIGIDGSIFIPKLVSTAYINAKIDFESRTCNKCKYFGSNEDTWNQDECPMHMIGDSAKEYCWKWKTNETI